MYEYFCDSCGSLGYVLNIFCWSDYEFREAGEPPSEIPICPQCLSENVVYEEIENKAKFEEIQENINENTTFNSGGESGLHPRNPPY